MASNLAAQAAALKTTLDAITGVTASTGDGGIMTSASIAMVIWPGTGDMHDIAMGGVWGYDDSLYADAMVKRVKDTAAWGLSLFTLVDSVKDAIDGDETLGDTCQVIRVEYDFQGQLDISGSEWYWIQFRFPLEEF